MKTYILFASKICYLILVVITPCFAMETNDNDDEWQKYQTGIQQQFSSIDELLAAQLAAEETYEPLGSFEFIDHNSHLADSLSDITLPAEFFKNAFKNQSMNEKRRSFLDQPSGQKSLRPFKSKKGLVRLKEPNIEIENKYSVKKLLEVAESDEAGNADAYYNLGIRYFHGKYGAIQNFAAAEIYLIAAHELGHFNAYNALGWLLLNEPKARDYIKAKSYLEQAAALGCAEATENLAQLTVFFMGDNASTEPMSAPVSNTSEKFMTEAEQILLFSTPTKLSDAQDVFLSNTIEILPNQEIQKSAQKDSIPDGKREVAD